MSEPPQLPEDDMLEDLLSDLPASTEMALELENRQEYQGTVLLRRPGWIRFAVTRDEAGNGGYSAVIPTRRIVIISPPFELLSPNPPDPPPVPYGWTGEQARTLQISIQHLVDAIVGCNPTNPLTEEVEIRLALVQRDASLLDEPTAAAVTERAAKFFGESQPHE